MLNYSRLYENTTFDSGEFYKQETFTQCHINKIMLNGEKNIIHISIMTGCSEFDFHKNMDISKHITFFVQRLILPQSYMHYSFFLMSFFADVIKHNDVIKFLVTTLPSLMVKSTYAKFEAKIIIFSRNLLWKAIMPPSVERPQKAHP